MGKIGCDDNLLDSIVKMSEGNPGAVTVLAELVKRTPEIDPQAGLGGLHYVLMMDDWGLYGSQIWMVFKDVCGQSIEGVIALFRAHQSGILSEKELQQIIDKDELYDFIPIIAAIQKELPTFAPSFAPDDMLQADKEFRDSEAHGGREE